MGKLNKDSSVPLYQQLVNEIRNQILTGALKENDRLLTEIELSKEYDISRITVRKAIEMLVEEEILVKKQGIGTFVAEKKLTRSVNGFMGFTQSCITEGRKSGTKLLRADLIDPTLTDIEQLHLEENEKVIRIVRVRSCDDVPVIVEENHFPQRFAYLLGKDLNGSLYEVLAESGTFMTGGIKNIGVCYATEEEKDILGVELNAALLLIKDVAYDSEGNPVHTCKSVSNPARYSITVMTTV